MLAMSARFQTSASETTRSALTTRRWKRSRSKKVPLHRSLASDEFPTAFGDKAALCRPRPNVQTWCTADKYMGGRERKQGPNLAQRAFINLPDNAAHVTVSFQTGEKCELCRREHLQTICDIATKASLLFSGLGTGAGLEQSYIGGEERNSWPFK